MCFIFTLKVQQFVVGFPDNIQRLTNITLPGAIHLWQRSMLHFSANHYKTRELCHACVHLIWKDLIELYNGYCSYFTREQTIRNHLTVTTVLFPLNEDRRKSLSEQYSSACCCQVCSTPHAYWSSIFNSKTNRHIYVYICLFAI